MSRNTPHGQRPATPPFKPADEAKSALAAFDEDESAERPENGESVWRMDMDSVPRDGSLVALLVTQGAEEYVLARWGRWRVLDVSRWRQRIGWKSEPLNKPLPNFEPVGWARHDAMLGPVRAT